MDAETADRDGFLRGRRALVTASSRNLGAAIATALAHAGALVCIQYHASRDAGETLVRRLAAETGLDHVAVGGDTAGPDSIRTVVSQAGALLGGGVEVLVKNPGPF